MTFRSKKRANPIHAVPEEDVVKVFELRGDTPRDRMRSLAFEARSLLEIMAIDHPDARPCLVLLRELPTYKPNVDVATAFDAKTLLADIDEMVTGKKATGEPTEESLLEIANDAQRNYERAKSGLITSARLWHEHRDDEPEHRFWEARLIKDAEAVEETAKRAHDAHEVWWTAYQKRVEEKRIREEAHADAKAMKGHRSKKTKKTKEKRGSL